MNRLKYEFLCWKLGVEFYLGSSSNGCPSSSLCIEGCPAMETSNRNLIGGEDHNWGAGWGISALRLEIAVFVLTPRSQNNVLGHRSAEFRKPVCKST